MPFLHNLPVPGQGAQALSGQPEPFHSCPAGCKLEADRLGSCAVAANTAEPKVKGPG